jgi:hypothetical protein
VSLLRREIGNAKVPVTRLVREDGYLKAEKIRRAADAARPAKAGCVIPFSGITKLNRIALAIADSISHRRFMIDTPSYIHVI